MARTRILNSKIILVILIGVLSYLAFSLNQALGKKKIIDQKIASLKKEIKELHNYQESLSKEKDYFQSQDFMEKEARRILNYQKPGEKVFAVIPPKKPIPSQDTRILQDNHQTKNTNSQNQSNFYKWINYFFK